MSGHFVTEQTHNSIRAACRRCIVRLACVSLLGLLFLVGAATAAEPAAQTIEAESATEPEHDEATARFFNRDIVTFRSDFLGRSPALRARTAEENIELAVSQPGVVAVDFKELPQGLAVMLSGELVALVTPDDLDVLRNQTMIEARADIARDLGEAVQAAERAREPEQLFNGIFRTLLATAVAVALLVGLLWLSRRVEARVQRWVAQRAARLQQEPVRHVMGGLRTFAGWMSRLAMWLLVVVVIEEWVRFVLGQFDFTRPWAAAMTGWMIDQVSTWGHAIAIAMPGLVAAAVILFLARLLAQTISMTFRGVQSGRFQLFGIDSEVAEPTRKLVVAVVWLFAIAMAYPYLPGAQTDAFKGLSVLIGLMVSLGASSIVSQAAGGFTIIYSRTMKVGDLVSAGEVEGTVMQIGLFTTRIRTSTGVEVSIPNNVVLGGQLHNYSRHPDGAGMWLETGVTIGYDTPWRQVQRLLCGAAEKTGRVQTEPAPYVLQTALSDFYVEYRLRVRIQDVLARGEILSDLHANIQDAFNAAGVQIMSPNYEADPEQPKLVDPTHWEGVPAALDKQRDPAG
jgi:small-conductance mechanosensitive channel